MAYNLNSPQSPVLEKHIHGAQIQHKLRSGIIVRQKQNIVVITKDMVHDLTFTLKGFVGAQYIVNKHWGLNMI